MTGSRFGVFLVPEADDAGRTVERAVAAEQLAST